METDCRRIPECVAPVEHLCAVGAAEQVAAGGNRTFFICVDGVLGCGDNSKGQLGLPRGAFGDCVKKPTALAGLREKVGLADAGGRALNR